MERSISLLYSRERLPLRFADRSNLTIRAVFRNSVFRAVMIRTLRSIVVVLLAVVCSALLLRFAPGADVDEREMSGQLSNESIEQIREEQARRHSLSGFFSQYVAALLSGRMLASESFGDRLDSVIKERFETSAHTVLIGLMLGWAAALLLAIVVSGSHAASAIAAATVTNAVMLSVPSALVAFFCLLAQFPPYFAVAVTIFPRVFPVAEEQFRASKTAPHVVFARAKGLTNIRLFWAHVIPDALAPLLALVGVSTLLAIGVTIPIESLLDSPGIGQLAWKAALAREFPVLVSVTLFITTLTVVLYWLIDLALVSVRLRSL